MSIDSIRSDSPPLPPPVPPNSPDVELEWQDYTAEIASVKTAPVQVMQRQENPERSSGSGVYYLLFMLFEITAISMGLEVSSQNTCNDNSAVKKIATATIATLGCVFLGIGCSKAINED